MPTVPGDREQILQRDRSGSRESFFPEARPIKDILNTGISETPVKRSFYVAKDKNPDKEAEVLKLSNQYNLDPQFVERNFDDINRNKHFMDFDAKESPSLTRYLAKPENASVSQDDFSSLSGMDKALAALRKSRPGLPRKSNTNFFADLDQAGQAGIHQLFSGLGVAGLLYGKMTLEEAQNMISANAQLANEIRAKAPDYVQEFNRISKEEVEGIDAGLQKMSAGYKQLQDKDILNGLKEFGAGTLGVAGNVIDYVGAVTQQPKGFAYGLTESLAQSFPASLTGLAGGKTGAALGAPLGPLGIKIGGFVGLTGGAFVGSTVLNSIFYINEELQKRGYDLSNPEEIARVYSNHEMIAEVKAEAERKGLTQGSIDAFFTALGGRFIAKARPGIVSKGIATAKDIAVQTVGEGAAEFAGQAAAKKDLSKASLGEAIQESIMSLGHSVGDTLTGVSIRSALPIKTTEAAKAISEEVGKSMQAQIELQSLQDLNALAKESKTAARMPEKLGEFVNIAAGGRAVYFQIDDWDKFFLDKGMSPSKAVEEIFGDPKKYYEAKELGIPLEVPIDKYAEKIAPSPNADELLTIARTSVDGKSLPESVSIMQAAPATIEELAAEAKSAEVQVDEIESNVKAQLEAAGVAPADASQYAILEARRFRTRAARLGVSPEELFKQQGLKITSEAAAGGQVFEQAKKIERPFWADAKNLGFDTSTIYYHGGPSGIEEFKTNKKGANKFLEGIYLTKSKNEADRYASMSKNKAEPNVYPLYIRGKFLNLDNTDSIPSVLRELNLPEVKLSKSKQYKYNPEMNSLMTLRLAVEKSGVKSKDVDSTLRQMLIDGGYSGVITDNGLVVSVFDSKDIRHIEAAFDETKSSSGNIYSQSGELGPRGQIRISPDRTIEIALLKNMNLSTYLHEMGHKFLEEMRDDVAAIQALPEKTAAQQGILEDADRILEYLGVKSFDEIETKHHEKWAETAEEYFKEGKAPSSKLKKAFRNFRNWLLSIYGAFKRSGVNINPEIRGVFERLLATDEEILEAQADLASEPLFIDPIQEGMTPKLAEKYNEAINRATISAMQTLENKALETVRRRQKKEWQAQYKKVREEVEKQVNESKAYSAVDKLRANDEIKINKKLTKLKGLPRGIFKEDGISPEVAESLLGIRLEELVNLPNKERVIDGLAETRMLEQYPDLLNSDQIEAEAMKALHNKDRAEYLRLELEHMASEEFSTLKGITKRLIQRAPTTAEIKSQVERILGGKNIREVKPYLYLRGEKKAAKDAAAAWGRGDYEAAFQAKRKELINHELYRASIEAAATIKDSISDFREISRVKNEDLEGKRDTDFVSAAKALIAFYGFGRTDKSPMDFLSSVKSYDPDRYEAIAAIIEPLVSKVKPFEGLTYNEFLEIKQAVDGLWDLSKSSMSMDIQGQKMAQAEAANLLIQDLSTFDKKKKAGYEKARTDWDNFKTFLLSARAVLTRVESWASVVGKNATNIIFRPIVEATTTFREENKKYQQKMKDLVQGHAKFITKEKIFSNELGYEFKSKAELLGAIAHRGNLSNFSKLLRGRGWGQINEFGVLDTSRWDAFEKRMIDEGVLVKEDYEFIQGIWDLFEEMKPEAQRAHKKLYGYYFNEITSEEFTNKHGTYRGGYVPAIADPLVALDAGLQQEKEIIENLPSSFAFPTTGRGFTKARVDNYAAALSLDIQRFNQHIDKVMRFVHIEPAVKQTAKLLWNRDLRAAIDSVDEKVVGDMLIPWLQRTAQQRVQFSSATSSFWRSADNVFGAMRRNTGLAIMTANVTNTLQQVTGLVSVMTLVKPKHIRNSLMNFMTNRRNMVRDIQEKSVFMRNRNGTQAFDITKSIQKILVNPTKYERALDFAQENGYILQQTAQNFVDSVVWNAAYDQAVQAGTKEADAIFEADAAVRRTQGSFNAEDISSIEAGSPGFRLFTMFYSYFNMQANLLASETIKTARDLGLKKGAAKMFYTVSMGFVLPAAMTELIVRAMSGKFDDDEDDLYIDDFLYATVNGLTRNATAFVPFVGSGIQAAINVQNNKWYDDRPSTSPAISVIESAITGNSKTLGQAIDPDKEVNTKRAVRDALAAISLITGLPVSPLAKPISYLIDLAEGDADPENPIDLIRGLITGRSGQ